MSALLKSALLRHLGEADEAENSSNSIKNPDFSMVTKYALGGGFVILLSLLLAVMGGWGMEDASKKKARAVVVGGA